MKHKDVLFVCVPGESGLGKSTLVNSLFLTDLHKDRKLLNAEGESPACQKLLCLCSQFRPADETDFPKCPLDVFHLKSASVRRWRSQSTRWTSRKRG